MQPPMTLPDDHFKKPYLPQQQYMNHGLLLFPCPLFPQAGYRRLAGTMKMAVADCMTCCIPQANHQPTS